LPTEIFEGSHVIAKMLNTTFTAVCKQPDLNKAFDVEHSTSLSKIKEEILVDLAARGLEVRDRSKLQAIVYSMTHTMS
jgi:hypothetical protein